MATDEWQDPPKECKTGWKASYERLYLDGYHAIVCPCCAGDALRIYWRALGNSTATRHARKGSGWMWCHMCHSFEHWSGLVPLWWPSCDPMTGATLHTDPRELEDRWEDIVKLIATSEH